MLGGFMAARTLVSILALLLAFPMQAQVHPRNLQANRESLLIGTIALYLGMQQETVISQLTVAGYSLTPFGKDEFYVFQNKDNNSILGVVAFTNKRLSFINRDWTPDDSDAASVGNGIYGALSAAYAEGRSTCSLSTSVEQNPSAETKYVNLVCGPGQKYVSIMITRYQGKELVSVSEILRTPQPD